MLCGNVHANGNHTFCCAVCCHSGWPLCPCARRKIVKQGWEETWVRADTHSEVDKWSYVDPDVIMRHHITAILCLYFFFVGVFTFDSSNMEKVFKSVAADATAADKWAHLVTCLAGENLFCICLTYNSHWKPKLKAFTDHSLLKIFLEACRTCMAVIICSNGQLGNMS